MVDVKLTKVGWRPFDCQTCQLETYLCRQCKFTSVGSLLLSKHVKEVHAQNVETQHYVDHLIQGIFCTNCPFKTYSRLHWVTHLRTCRAVRREVRNFHRHRKWWECDQCPYKTYIKSDLKRHNMFSHNSKQNGGTEPPHEHDKWFKCDKCLFSSAYRTNLDQHINAKHVDDSSAKWFDCKQCSFKTKWRTTLCRHYKAKHSWCETCTGDARDGKRSHRHATKAQNKILIDVEHAYALKMFSCAKCLFNTYFYESWVQHCTLKHGLMKFKCDQCNYKTKFEFFLAGHKREVHSK